jgi:hypothetical protein
MPDKTTDLNENKIIVFINKKLPSIGCVAKTVWAFFSKLFVNKHSLITSYILVIGENTIILNILREFHSKSYDDVFKLRKMWL